jgi:hypothetical protein
VSVTTLYDTAVVGTPVTASGTIWTSGQDISFWLNVVSNFILGQASAAPVTFTVIGQGRPTTVTIVYGETRSIPVTGNLVGAKVLSGSTPSCRVVLSEEEQVLQVLTVTDINTSGSAAFSFGQNGGIEGSS